MVFLGYTWGCLSISGLGVIMYIWEHLVRPGYKLLYNMGVNVYVWVFFQILQVFSLHLFHPHKPWKLDFIIMVDPE